MKKVALLLNIFAATLFVWGCGSSMPNQVCAIKADTAYYNFDHDAQKNLHNWSKGGNGLKTGCRILVTWKTGYYDNESLISAMLPDQSGDFLSGKEIYVPRRNIDFETKQAAIPAAQSGQAKPVNQNRQTGQSASADQKPAADDSLPQGKPVY